MGLRRQLLLLSSLTLILPWVGREYLREMEASLRQGQQLALTTTADAVAARLGETRLQVLLQVPEHPQSVFYAHRLPQPMVVDGYFDDWRAQEFQPQRLAQTPGAELLLGTRDDLLFGWLQVPDGDRQFHHPAMPVTASDHLLLWARGGQQSHLLRIHTAAPGRAQVERHIGTGWQREHRLQAVWNEQSDAYAVEFRLPLSWASEGLAIEIWDGTWHEAFVETVDTDPFSAGVAELYASGPPQFYRVLTQLPQLVEALNPFARPGVRLYLTDRQGWILATSGSLYTSPSEDDEGAFRWLLRWLLGHPDLPSLPSALEQGRLVGEELQAEQAQQVWYRRGQSTVGRVTLPLLPASADQREVILVAEQAMDATEVLTAGAMGRLLGYSLSLTVLVGALLLLYASVLSWRVRSLSRWVRRAVDTEGRIQTVDFPVSRFDDEIGDLSRNYSALLARLQAYTRYLESLAGKLSHELRTPLAIVRSSLDNLEHTSLDAQQRTYATRASEGVQRLSSLLGSMSAAARLEQTLARSEREPLDCADFLRSMAQAYSDLYRPREVQLRIVCEAPCRVSAVPELLAQMLDKLVENAADFSVASQPIELLLDRQGQALVIQVINTGPPLPQALQGQIFDSMVSVRDVSEAGVHLGMGLYIARLIAQFHGGELRAYNHSQGAKVVFEVVLPELR